MVQLSLNIFKYSFNLFLTKMQKVKSLNEKIINIVLIYSLVKSKKAPNQIKKFLHITNL